MRAAIRQGQGCYFVCCPLRCCPSLSLGQCLGHLRSVSIKGPLLPQRTDATKKTPLAPHYEKKSQPFALPLLVLFLFLHVSFHSTLRLEGCLLACHPMLTKGPSTSPAYTLRCFWMLLSYQCIVSSQAELKQELWRQSLFFFFFFSSDLKHKHWGPGFVPSVTSFLTTYASACLSFKK